jgi:Zn-dependent protease with chaperone function
MLKHVTGLFGWVKANDQRTFALFLTFMLYFQLIAVATSFLPLALIFPKYAPIYGWQGYFSVIVPLTTLVATGLFFAKLFWHVHVVQRETKFHYVDDVEERRLCSIIEPLTIMAGIKTPFVGVIETPEMNAFACGTSQSNCVIVVTRGLIDGLDDDQLAGVIAHEIAHIKNGDMRLMAVANICVETMQSFFKVKKVANWHLALSWLFTLFLPILFLLSLAIGFIHQVGFWFVFATRLGIASSREFIADAFAIQLTKNPAAFVSALQTIDGRSCVEGLNTSHSAMMIDGQTDGENASHPRIVERLAAIVKLTGSMALIGTTRRDTRPRHIRSYSTGVAATFGKRPPGSYVRNSPAKSPAQTMYDAKDAGLWTLIDRVASQSPNNMFGMPKAVTFVLPLWVFLFLGINHQALASPDKLIAKFDTRTIAFLAKMAAPGIECYTKMPNAIAEYRNGNGPMKSTCGSVSEGTIADQARAGMWHTGGSTFSSEAPDEAKIEYVKANRCFISHFRPMQSRVRGLDEVDGDYSMANFLQSVERSRAEAETAPPDQQDDRLISYVQTRELIVGATWNLYGEAGQHMAESAFATPPHRAVLQKLGTRMSDPAFVAKLEPLRRAELEVIAANPDDFSICELKPGIEPLRPKVANPNASVAQEMRDAGVSLPGMSSR